MHYLWEKYNQQHWRRRCRVGINRFSWNDHCPRHISTRPAGQAGRTEIQDGAILVQLGLKTAPGKDLVAGKLNGWNGTQAGQAAESQPLLRPVNHNIPDQAVALNRWNRVLNKRTRAQICSRTRAGRLCVYIIHAVELFTSTLQKNALQNYFLCANSCYNCHIFFLSYSKFKHLCICSVCSMKETKLLFFYFVVQPTGASGQII